MKKHLLFLFAVFASGSLWAQCGNIIITGVFDGPLTGGTPKGVELYIVNNIANLSIYGLGSANNGGGSDGEEFTFPAVPATAGTFIYVASEATEFNNFFGFNPDYTTAAMGINGDDAIELFCSGTVEDVFGDINVDGTGQAWEYLDGWAYRANGTGPDGTTFVPGSWSYSSPNALDAEISNGTAATPFPLGTYIAGVAPTAQVGFSVAASSTPETTGANVITVTMDAAPAADVTIDITDAGTGTATPTTDYTFTPQSLVFSAAAAYPNTQTLTGLNIVDDGLGDNEEYLNLNLALALGTANLLTTNHRVVITETRTGLFVNEISQGATGTQEWAEMLVIGTPGTTLDLRGYIIDDNNGVFSDGSSSGLGIADGYIAFSNDCNWEKVPVGAIIIVYNSTTPDPGLPAADPTDANGDLVYVCPIFAPGFGLGCGSPTVNDYFDAFDSAPTIGDPSYPATTQDPCWDFISFLNGSDGFQIRNPGAVFQHGISYGTNIGSGCSGNIGVFPCQMRTENHPDFGIYDEGAGHFSLNGNNTTYAFTNAYNDDPKLANNWEVVVASTNSTPGVGNSAANTAFINTLRGTFTPTIVNSTYTCNLGPNQTRTYLNPNDEIILDITNNGATDHGSTSGAATFGLGESQNTNLTGQPYFADPEWQVTPTVLTGGDYTVTFYLSAADLTAITNFINTSEGTALAEADIASQLKVYRRDGANSPATATADPQVEIGVTTVGTQGTFTTYQAPFNTFSTFALGTPVSALPVEGLSLQAELSPAGIVYLNWQTLQEWDTDYFSLERKSEQGVFQSVNQQQAAGYSETPRYYQYTDQNAPAGVQIYRIKQVDIDGGFTYSDNVEVEVFPAGELVLLQSYPSPAQSEFNIQLNAPQSGTASLNIYQMDGKLASQESIKIEAGNQTIQTDLSDLASGYYLYEIRFRGQRINGKIVKW
ncbi:MAG: T9SS type A sorting domain-containing protein [Bacteroidota bacterium]